MANFEIAYDITMKNEGGYSNDPVDSGGETFKGISRKNHPSWSGWVLLDGMKKQINFPKSALLDNVLCGKVKEFYKKMFWDVYALDSFSSQSIANEMFDTGVNMGTVKAAKFLQTAINKLNKGGSVCKNLVVDGKVGPGTIEAMNACIKAKGDTYLYKVMNILQGSFYIDIMDNNESQEKYAYGWLDRVEFIKR